ncbi:hypothetical protein HELRODRAFT_183891 [Helobdella robusta]|uniref:Uncharacterized protein n=1 Tax=Helobdella robusta TaxID=6412 RepID=T1FKA5_HELRO|nr:hypothetical protein HELRODRAFT_183891 [Helobdella robusta]ESO09746.1 hypothetical protein HELRODRAFT_183891 [Helobdella robusta]
MEGSIEAVAPAKELSTEPETECLKQNGASEEPVVSTNGSGDDQKRKSIEGVGDHAESKKLKTCHKDDEEGDEEDDEEEEDDSKDDGEKESAEETNEECEKVDKENVPESEDKSAKTLEEPVAASTGDTEDQEATC